MVEYPVQGKWIAWVSMCTRARLTTWMSGACEKPGDRLGLGLGLGLGFGLGLAHHVDEGSVREAGREVVSHPGAKRGVQQPALQPEELSDSRRAAVPAIVSIESATDLSSHQAGKGTHCVPWQYSLWLCLPPDRSGAHSSRTATWLGLGRGG